MSRITLPLSIALIALLLIPVISACGGNSSAALQPVINKTEVIGFGEVVTLISSDSPETITFALGNDANSTFFQMGYNGSSAGNIPAGQSIETFHGVQLWGETVDGGKTYVYHYAYDPAKWSKK